MKRQGLAPGNRFQFCLATKDGWAPPEEFTVRLGNTSECLAWCKREGKEAEQVMANAYTLALLFKVRQGTELKYSSVERAATQYVTIKRRTKESMALSVVPVSVRRWRERYCLPPLYLPFGPESFDGHRLHGFQSAILHVSEQKESCLIVTAPTGSGKTFAFALPTVSAPSRALLSRKTLVVAPTNALVAQITKDLTDEWRPKGYSTGSITAADLISKGMKRPAEVFEIIRQNNLVVSNPDLLLSSSPAIIIAGCTTPADCGNGARSSVQSPR